MRPKKIVLYISASDQAISLMRFMLLTNGYAVRTASTVDDGVAWMTQSDIGAVLIDMDMGPVRPAGTDAVLRVKATAPHVPAVLLGDVDAIYRAGHSADAVWSRLIGSAELLERLKVICARKRGPRKGSAAAKRMSVRPPQEARIA